MIFFVSCAILKDLPSEGSNLFAELFLRTGKIKTCRNFVGQTKKYHVNISCFAFLICVKNSVDDTKDLHMYVGGQLVCKFLFHYSCSQICLPKKFPICQEDR